MGFLKNPKANWYGEKAILPYPEKANKQI